MSLECRRCHRGIGKVQRVKAGLGCYVGGVAIYRGLCEESFVVEKKSEAVGERKSCGSERRAGAETWHGRMCAVCREGTGWLQRSEGSAVHVLCRDFDF